MNEQELDQLLNDLRQEAPDAAAEAAARRRVWDRISGGAVCAQFREQFAAYREGGLAEAPRMLLEDHLARCANCRRVFNPAAGNIVAMPAGPAPARRFAVPRWAIAAGIAAVALFAGRDTIDRALAPGGPRATVAATNGNLYALQAATLESGAAVGDGEVIRTAAGARAQLRLADGSMVELNERTELSIAGAWSGQTIHLERGDIIVHAAKQRRGYLKVVTRDSEAAVKGTIFTVSAGTAGSLVGVVEGAVAVTQPGTERVLQPGEQAATTAALGKVTVREAVSWSEEREKHFALLGELAAISRQLPAIEARAAGKALAMLPPDVQIYAAIPNLGPTVNQAVALIEERSRDNAALREWWGSASAERVKSMIERFRVLAPMIGDEMVFLVMKPGMALMMAEVKTGQAEALAAELTRLMPAGGAYRIQDGMLLVSDSAPHLQTAAALLGQGAQTEFAQELGRRYARGVAWMVGADVKALQGEERKALAGTPAVRYAFAEQRMVEGNEENEATVQFDGPREGVAAWLAAPGSAGSAEYASSDAVAVFSAATRNPRQIFDDAIGLAPGIAEHVREFEARTGVNVANDLAAALGTDFTLSLETATIPIPGWVAAVEVYQPSTLNAAIARLAESYNREAPAERKLTLARETADGREWHSLTMSGIGLHWTFDRGYWLVAMDRAVALRAMATRESGFPLVRSAKFRAQMPTLAGTQISGFAWFNLGSTADLLAGFAKSPAMRKLLAVREPSLITFNGETERIQIASRTRFTNLMLDTMLSAGAGRTRPR